MKTLLTLLLLLFANNIFACVLTWTPPAEGGTVEAYRLYINSDSAIDVGNVTTWDCTGRTGTVYATAYNAVGESEASNIVNFLRIPGAPGSLTVTY